MREMFGRRGRSHANIAFTGLGDLADRTAASLTLARRKRLELAKRRDPSRLRARCLRCLHCADRRAHCAWLPDPRGAGLRACSGYHRGAHGKRRFGAGSDRHQYGTSSFQKNALNSCLSISHPHLVAVLWRGNRRRNGRWLADGGNSLVLLQAEQPCQCLVDPGIDHCFKRTKGSRYSGE
jgi:hypothetical protein